MSSQIGGTGDAVCKPGPSEAVRHVKTLIEQRVLLTPFSSDSLCTLDYLAALMEVSSPACANTKSQEAEFACTVTEEYANLYGRSESVQEACTRLKEVSRGEPIKHAVFVLLDGYGWNLLKAFSNLKRSLSSKSFIAEHAEGRPPARTVFPATTAAALSAYGSLRLPAHHAQWGWRVRLAKNGQVVQPLAGDFTFSESLGEDDVFKFSSVYPRLATDEGRQVCCFSAYDGSPFSDRMCGKDTPHVFNGEMSIGDAIPALRTHWASADENEKSTFAYVYSANPDKVEHACGPFDAEDSTVISPGVLESIEQLDEQMRDLCEETQPRKHKRMILMMADHGQYNVQKYVTLPRNLRAMFETMTVEPATPSFHLKPSTTPEEFRAAWEAAGLSSYWQLLDQEELLATGLLGPELSPEARETLGDLTGIALGSYLLELESEEGPGLAQQLWGMVKSKGVLGTVSGLWEMRGLLWKLKGAITKGKYHHSGHHGGAQQCEVEVPVFVWAD